MAGREDEYGDAEPGGAYDDWFDEPEPPTERRRRGQRRSAEIEPYEDTWVFEDERERRPRTAPREPLVILGRTITPIQAAILGLSALVILIAIMAAAGVFSGGSKPVATPPTATTTATPPAVTPTVTTPVTTPKQTAQPPTSTLKPGDSGPQVVLLQKALKALGFTLGKADGSYGPATKQAVATFQNSKELTADGVFGPATLAALTQALSGSSGSQGAGTGTGTTTTTPQVPTTALKPGDSGAQVTLLQQDLAALGYTTGGTDGTYGPGTQAAVMAFQTAQGLNADGLAGAKTLAALQQALTATG